MEKFKAKSISPDIENDSDKNTDNAEQYLKKCQQLQTMLTVGLWESEAKWRLFISAAKTNGTKDLCLPVFVKDMEHLSKLIKDTPSLSVLRTQVQENNYNHSNRNVILLLHWLLIQSNEPSIHLVDTACLKECIQDYDEKAPTIVFKINYAADCKKEQIFNSRKSDFGTKFGFYSCNPDNLYNVLYGGQQLNKGSKSGNIYLCETPRPILNKTPYTKSINIENSAKGLKILALCEFINRLQYVRTNFDNELNATTICIVLPDIIRMRYLLCYMEPEDPIPVSSPVKEKTVNISSKEQEVTTSEQAEPISLKAMAVTPIGISTLEDKSLKQEEVSIPTEATSMLPVRHIAELLEQLNEFETNSATECFGQQITPVLTDKPVPSRNSLRKTWLKRILRDNAAIPLGYSLLLLGALTYLYRKNIKSLWICAGQKLGKLFSKSV